jgi:hypothetical protein
MSGQLHALAALPPPPRKRAPGTHWIGGWVGSRASPDDVERRKILLLAELELDLSTVQPVASLYTNQLSYPKSLYTYTIESCNSEIVGLKLPNFGLPYQRILKK